MRDLHGKRVWVSGASGALGSALVETSLALGAEVIASARRRTRLLDLRASLHHHDRLHVAENDAADPEGVEALLDGLFRQGPLDAAIQCAGSFAWGPLADATDAQVRAAVQANLLASAWTLRGCLGRMRAQGSGTVVLVAADRADAPAANFAIYGATKAAVAHLARAAAEEVKDSGVSVHCLLPGALDTPANRAAGLDPGAMLPLRTLCEQVVELLTSAHGTG